ncbi:hypothetical protein K438DRAFT_1968862 [Mycena galopus ATCC 62051]|nr:hypothetical protein K438DRAFT_1968862 [Mycena galopus ATCC 62051]
MSPPTTKVSQCPAPTSGSVRKELGSSESQLANAAFGDAAQRLAFLDLVYDLHGSPRISFVNGRVGSETFGELGPVALKATDLGKWLGPGMVLLDIGAGVGEPALYAALLTGCDTISYEICDAPAKLAALLFRKISAKCAAEGYPMGCHQYVHADIETRPYDFPKAVASANVIILNNKLFSAELMLYIETQLKLFAQPNTRIFVTAELGSLRRPTSTPNIRQTDDISLLLTKERDIGTFVSWTGTETTVYHFWGFALSAGQPRMAPHRRTT